VAVDANGDFWVTDAIIGASVGERRLFKVDKTTGVATIISVDGFFDQPQARWRSRSSTLKYSSS